MARMGWCPRGRLFEAASCGAPILTDWWEGLDAFFELDSEILVARTTGRRARRARDADGDLASLARRARERTLDEHTAARRAREMIAALELAAA